jgi:hypothetical protein
LVPNVLEYPVASIFRVEDQKMYGIDSSKTLKTIYKTTWHCDVQDYNPNPAQVLLLKNIHYLSTVHLLINLNMTVTSWLPAGIA